MFKNLAKIEITHMPYRGAGPALTDLLGGQVDVMFAHGGGGRRPSSKAASCARSR